MVFGDIDLEAHREWEQRVCAAAEVRAHLPLWSGDRRGLVDDFWAAGFRARVVAVQDGKDLQGYLGADFDGAMVEHCERVGVDACGENGEFHTVVVDGPLFRRPLGLRGGRVVASGGYLAMDFTVVGRGEG